MAMAVAPVVMGAMPTMAAPEAALGAMPTMAALGAALVVLAALGAATLAATMAALATGCMGWLDYINLSLLPAWRFVPGLDCLMGCGRCC